MNAPDRTHLRTLRVMQLGSPAELYGAERWILALVRNLDPQRVESTVATIRDHPALQAPLCRAAQAAGFATHIFECHGRVNPAAIAQVRRFIRANDIDILHTHGYKTDLIGRLATLGTGCRLVSTPHGWSRDAGWQLQCYEWLDRLVFPFFDAVVPLSSDLHAELHRLPGLAGRLHLIPNGVDLAEVERVTAPAADICRCKARGETIVGYIGQLIARKGLPTLLHAFRAADIPRKRLVVVGEGDQRAGLEALAAELGLSGQVTFTGFREDRIALLKGFDAFVLPSRLEGIPRCLMEAMAAGVPVIASDIAGCNDLVTHGETGLLFQVDHVAALTAALQAVVSQPELRQRMAAQAHRLVVSSHSARRMGEDYERLYHSLAH